MPYTSLWAGLVMGEKLRRFRYHCDPLGELVERIPYLPHFRGKTPPTRH